MLKVLFIKQKLLIQYTADQIQFFTIHKIDTIIPGVQQNVPPQMGVGWDIFLGHPVHILIFTIFVYKINVLGEWNQISHTVKMFTV